MTCITLICHYMTYIKDIFLLFIFYSSYFFVYFILMFLPDLINFCYSEGRKSNVFGTTRV